MNCTHTKHCKSECVCVLVCVSHVSFSHCGSASGSIKTGFLPNMQNKYVKIGCQLLLTTSTVSQTTTDGIHAVTLEPPVQPCLVHWEPLTARSGLCSRHLLSFDFGRFRFLLPRTRGGCRQRRGPCGLTNPH